MMKPKKDSRLSDNQSRKPQVELRLTQAKASIRYHSRDESFMSGPSFSLRPDPRRALEGETITINRDWVLKPDMQTFG